MKDTSIFALVILSDKSSMVKYISEFIQRSTKSQNKVLIVDSVALFSSSIVVTQLELSNHEFVKIEVPDLDLKDWFIANIDNMKDYDVIMINDLNALYHELNYIYQKNVLPKIWRFLLLFRVFSKQNGLKTVFTAWGNQATATRSTRKIFDFLLVQDGKHKNFRIMQNSSVPATIEASFVNINIQTND